jgi:hypothetical protein
MRPTSRIHSDRISLFWFLLFPWEHLSTTAGQPAITVYLVTYHNAKGTGGLTVETMQNDLMDWPTDQNLTSPPRGSLLQWHFDPVILTPSVPGTRVNKEAHAKMHTSSFALCLAAGTLVRGQNPPSTLDFDTSRLTVTLGLDRKTYFTGEVAEVTLEISNPSSRPVKVPLPFAGVADCLYLSWKVGDEFKIPRETLCPSEPDRSNTATFAAGEHKKLVLQSHDKANLSWGPVLSEAPSRAGTYRLIYSYGSSEAVAEFEVVSPELEAFAVARVRDVLFNSDPARAKPRLLKRYVYVVALRADDQSYICVSQHGTDFGPPDCPQPGRQL